MRRKIFLALGVAGLLFGLSACSCQKNAQTGAEECTLDLVNPSCAENGNNVSGHIYFTGSGGAQVVAGSKIMIAYSTDSFVTSNNVVSVIKNDQGHTIIPYDACVPTNTNVQLRVFQSTDGLATWSAGESNGRYDGINTGHAAFIPLLVVQPSSTTWNKRGAIDIFIDATASQ